MCKVCTEAVHSVALWARVTSQVWTCVKYMYRSSPFRSTLNTRYITGFTTFYITLLPFYPLRFYAFTLLPFYPFTLLRFFLRFYAFTLLPFYAFTLLPFYVFTLLPLLNQTTFTLLSFYAFTAERRKKNTLEQERSGWRLSTSHPSHTGLLRSFPSVAAADLLQLDCGRACPKKNKALEKQAEKRWNPGTAGKTSRTTCSCQLPLELCGDVVKWCKMSFALMHLDYPWLIHDWNLT